MRKSRARKDSIDFKGETLVVRMTKIEKQQLRVQAEMRGLALSEYVRTLCKG